MSFCINCGQKLVEGAKFCAGCGSAIENQNQQQWAGKVVKCPSCGEDIPSFTAICPACRHEFRETNASSSIKELSIKLQQIEKTREPQHITSLIGKLYGNDGQISKTDGQKISLIKNFPIPNTKEDTLEFMILASSNINYKLYGLGDKGIITASQREVSDAWLAKMEQIYEKAKIMFIGKPEFTQIESIYLKANKKLKKKRKEIPILIIAEIGIPIFIIAICLCLPKPSIEKQIENRNHHLEYVVKQIEDDISEGKFTDAYNKAYTLTFDYELSTEYSEYWEKKKQKILNQIEEASSK